MAIELSTLRKTQKGATPPLLTVYGTAGVGKTGLALNAPDVAYLPTEPRFAHYEVFNVFQTEDNPNAICQSYNHMCEALTALIEEEHDFKTVVIDSLDHFEPMIWNAVIQKYAKNGDHIDENTPDKMRAGSIEDYGFGKGYALADGGWSHYYRLLNRLRDKKNMIIVQIAHYAIKEEQSAEGESYDQYQIKLHKRAAALTRELSDGVFFAKHKSNVAKVGQGFKERNIAVGTGERVLICQARPSCVVKSSFDTLPAEIPLQWNALAEHIPFINNLNNSQ